MVEFEYCYKNKFWKHRSFENFKIKCDILYFFLNFKKISISSKASSSTSSSDEDDVVDELESEISFSELYSPVSCSSDKEQDPISEDKFSSKSEFSSFSSSSFSRFTNSNASLLSSYLCFFCLLLELFISLTY